MNTRTVLLWHNNGEEQIVLTVNPAELTVSRPNANRVCPLALGGTVNVWSGRGLGEVRLRTFLPAEASPFFDRRLPETTLEMLKRWQDSGDPVRLIISDTDVNDAFLIENVSEIFREGDEDVGLLLELREYKFRSALNQTYKDTDEPTLPKREDERPAQTQYIVKKGDTLWGIASRFYGDGTKWGILAEKNGVTNPRTLQIGRVLRL